MARPKKKKPAGRPRFIFTDEIIENVLKCARIQLSIDSLCRINGFSPDLLDKHPDIKAQVLKAREEGKAKVAQTAMTMGTSGKDSSMTQYLCKSLLKWVPPDQKQTLQVNVTLESLIAKASEVIENKATPILEGSVEQDSDRNIE